MSHVTKRNGKKESLDMDKIHAVVQRACEGLDVSASEIELRSRVQFEPGIKTSEIHDLIVRAAADLVSEDTPDYQYAAGRLLAYGIHKQVFGTSAETPPKLSDWILARIDNGVYDKVFRKVSAAEWAVIDGAVDHTKDSDYTYAGMMQFYTKYLLRNRVTGQLYETPQFALMAICVAAFIDEHDAVDKLDLDAVLHLYDALHSGRISLPTPIMAALRSPQKQFSSCVLVETGDSLDSINATSAAIVKYVSQKAGIGIGAGSIRAQGSPVRGGDTAHTGAVGFFKHFYTAVASCSQGGVRKGSATLAYPIWHLDVEDFLVLKNNKGTEETRIRQMDYSVQFSKLFYERLIQGGNITLFSPHSVPGLYDAFFADQVKFRQLYEAAELDPTVRKKVVPAIELFSAFMMERKDTGRVYLQNVDHANEHGSFDPSVAPIRMSNLCAEIDLPTVPLEDVNSIDGEIALCTLAAQNWGAYSSATDPVMRKDAFILVRVLDNILTYQNYPVLAAQMATMNRRPLGVGITNFAYWMAKQGFSYDDVSDSCLATVDEWAANWSKNLIDASIALAAERGACPLVDQTKYGKGILPIDTAKADVCELVMPTASVDWESTRAALRLVGIRNSTLMAGMPCETSALVSNHTNGVEPIRSFVTKKKNKDLVVPVVAPGIDRPKIKKAYTLLWSIKSPRGYLKIMSVLQRHFDQGISVNTSYNQEHYSIEEGIPMSVLLGDLLFFYKMGGKQLYYMNTNDGAGELEMKPEVDAVSATEDDANCDGCAV